MRGVGSLPLKYLLKTFFNLSIQGVRTREDEIHDLLMIELTLWLRGVFTTTKIKQKNAPDSSLEHMQGKSASCDDPPAWTVGDDPPAWAVVGAGRACFLIAKNVGRFGLDEASAVVLVGVVVVLLGESSTPGLLGVSLLGDCNSSSLISTGRRGIGRRARRSTKKERKKEEKFIRQNLLTIKSNFYS